MGTSRRRLFINATRVAGGVLLASCVPGDLTRGPAVTGASGTAAPASTRAKTILFGSEVEIVDGQPYNQSQTGAYGQVHASLYDCVTGRDFDGALVPGIALSWKALDDKTWQFKLRDDVKFHNGDPLTAEDVKWSIDHTYDKAAETIYASTFNTVGRIEVVDATTVNFIMKQPDPFLPDKLSARPGYVMPSKYFQSVGVEGMNAKPIGSGPYMFKERVPGSRFTIVKNENYWRGEAPADEISAIFRPDMSAQIAGLQTGELNLIVEVPYDQVGVLRDHPQTKHLSVPQVTIQKYILNTNVAPLDKKEVRHALSFAIDRDLLNKTLGQGLFEIANGPIPATEFAYDPSLPKMQYDPDRARSLLKQAGYNGEKIVIEVLPEKMDREQAVAEMWKAVGFNVEIVAMDNATRADKIKNVSFQSVSWAGFSSKYGDPDGMIWRTLKPGGSLRYWSNPEFDRLGTQQATSFDQERRKAIWKQMTAMLLDEMPWIYLWNEPAIWGLARYLDIKPSVEARDDFGPGRVTFGS